MSFSAYSKYKSGSIEWLGAFPEHWNVLPLREISRGGESVFIDGDWIESKDISESGIRYITTGNVGVGSYKEQGAGFISEEKFAELHCTEVREGDILISRLNLPLARACIAPNLGTKVVTAVDNVIVRPDSGYDRRFIVYMLSSPAHFANAEIIGRGATMQRLSRSQLSKIRFAFPPLLEQRAISNFLDHETSKIDALIHEQEELIALMSEKRKSVISNATTLGVKQNVQLKATDDPWLPHVPSHWRFANFQRFVSIAEGQVNPEVEPYRSMTLIAPNHVESGTGRLLAMETAAYQSAESGKYLCRNGDVIYSKIRPALRKVVLAPEDCLCSADMYPMDGGADIDNEFLAFFMLSEAFSAFAVIESDRVAMPKINRESLKAIKLPVPPWTEQREIVSFIKTELKKIDDLASEATLGIQLLRERRSSIISAAVTGKIDVRGQHV